MNPIARKKLQNWEQQSEQVSNLMTSVLSVFTKVRSAFSRGAFAFSGSFKRSPEAIILFRAFRCKPARS